MKHTMNVKYCSIRLILLTGLMLSVMSVKAETITLNSVSTNTVSIPHDGAVTPANASINAEREQTLMHQYAQTGVTNYLPIQTNLTPGDVTPNSIANEALIQSIFLIGSDERSKTWLTKNCDRLKQIHAIGLLVQVNTQEEISEIQTLGNGLMILPISPNELISKYSLQHYPVLITKEGIVQ